MKRLINSVALLIILLFISHMGFAQGKTLSGEGSVVSKKIELSEITKIGLGIPAEVYLTQGNKQKIEIKGQQNIIDIIQTEVKNGGWEIKTADNVRLKNIEKIEIHITMKSIESLAVGGSGSISGTNQFGNIINLNLSIGGSGNIKLNVEAQEIASSIGGSGKISLSGKAESLKVSLSGSGNVNADGIEVNNCEVSSSGSGDVAIHVKNKLKVSLAGSGNVRYNGTPQISSTVVGSGKVYTM